MLSRCPPSRSYSPSRPTTAQSRSGDPPHDSEESIVAILQSRQGGEVAAAAFSEIYGNVTLTQFGDSSTFVKTLTFLKANPPRAVLVPPSARPTVVPVLSATTGPSSQATLLARCIHDEFPRAAIVPVKRQYWDEQAGYEFLTQLSAKDAERHGTVDATRSKYYALSAVCALFKYLETQGTAFSPHSLKIRYAPFEGTCLIDSQSVKNLELAQNVLDPKSKQHLLGMLDRCCTPAGTRMLRANVLAPSTDHDQITGRYDAVAELVDSEETLGSLRKALECLKHIDLERLTSKILSSTSSTKLAAVPSRATRSILPRAGPDPSTLINQKLNHLLNLRAFLLCLASLRTSLEAARAHLLSQSLRVFTDPRLDELRCIVEESVNKDLWSVQEPLGGTKRGKTGAGNMRGEPGVGTRKLTRASRLFAIKSEKKRFLDVARETYRENMNDVNEFRDNLQTELGFEISLISTEKGDFLLGCSHDDWADKGREVQSRFTNINLKGKNVRFSSLELQKRNARIAESSLEVLLLSDEILDDIFEDIRADVACLYRCSEAVALLDMLASFADLSSQRDYVRPELTGTLAIKAGRNPLHEQFRLIDGSFVPNDIYASDSSTFQIITGSNMSGKSTLLRQIALLHVMAQIGCFVPAHYASFRPVSALLTRFSNDDDIEASLSTFALEMSTMRMILGAIEVSDRNHPCLVLVDELGRGTSPQEGIGIAHAIAEEIIRSRSLCFFATHFKELSTTLSRFPNVVSLHLETEVDRSRPDYSLSFHHRLIDGCDPLVHYGLELAKIAKLPTPVHDRAHLVALALDRLTEKKRFNSTAYRTRKRKQALLSLKGTLRELASSSRIEGSTMHRLLREIRQEIATLLEDDSAAKLGGSVAEDREGSRYSERDGMEDRSDRSTLETTVTEDTQATRYERMGKETVLVGDWHARGKVESNRENLVDEEDEEMLDLD